MDDKEPGELLKEVPETLSGKEFLEREWALRTLAMQENVIRFLLITYGGTIFLTFSIIIFEGFHFWGFNLEPTFLKWLGMAIGALFKKSW